MAFGFACNPCSVSDPATDTVKVSFPSPDAAEDKENVARSGNLETKAAEERAAAKRKAEESERNRLAEAAAEARRQEAEAAARRAAEKQAAAARAAQEEAEAEAQRQAAIQAALEAEEADRQQAEAADLAAKAEADRKVHEFLKTHGFKDDVNAKKSTLFKSKYPLHVAVKEQDPEMVKLLVLAGADKSLKNSSGNTPMQKAQQYTKAKKDSTSREVLLALDC
jgi:flagellar biosynthesis GTPase FlhF